MYTHRAVLCVRKSVCDITGCSCSGPQTASSPEGPWAPAWLLLPTIAPAAAGAAAGISCSLSLLASASLPRLLRTGQGHVTGECCVHSRTGLPPWQKRGWFASGVHAARWETVLPMQWGDSQAAHASCMPKESQFVCTDREEATLSEQWRGTRLLILPMQWGQLGCFHCPHSWDEARLPM